MSAPWSQYLICLLSSQILVLLACFLFTPFPLSIYSIMYVFSLPFFLYLYSFLVLIQSYEYFTLYLFTVLCICKLSIYCLLYIMYLIVNTSVTSLFPWVQEAQVPATSAALWSTTRFPSVRTSHHQSCSSWPLPLPPLLLAGFRGINMETEAEDRTRTRSWRRHTCRRLNASASASSLRALPARVRWAGRRRVQSRSSSRGRGRERERERTGMERWPAERCRDSDSASALSGCQAASRRSRASCPSRRTWIWTCSLQRLYSRRTSRWRSSTRSTSRCSTLSPSSSSSHSRALLQPHLRLRRRRLPSPAPARCLHSLHSPLRSLRTRRSPTDTSRNSRRSSRPLLRPPPRSTENPSTSASNSATHEFSRISTISAFSWIFVIYTV